MILESDTTTCQAVAKKEYIWSSDRTTLKVKFLNAVPPKWANDWNTRNIIDLANRWRGKVAETYGKASECVPKFEENKEIGDIRVWFITDEDRENGMVSCINFAVILLVSMFHFKKVKEHVLKLDH